MSKRSFKDLPDPEEFRARILKWVRSMKVANGEYRESQTKGPTLSSSGLALSTRMALKNPISEEEKQAVIQRVQALQDPKTGKFSLDQRDTYLAELDWGLEITSSVRGLGILWMLDARPLYPLQFVQEVETIEGMIRLLETRNWVSAWMSSCDAECVYDLVMLEGHPIKEWLEAYFDWLDAHQDTETGYWGPNMGSEIWQGFGSTFHILIPYYIEKRPIQYVERIVDTTLALQSNPDPLGQLDKHSNILSIEFRSQAGYLNHWMRNHNALDAVNMLLNLRERVDSSKQKKIDKAIEKAVVGVVRTQNPDGGLGQYEGAPSDQDATAFGVWALVMAGYLDGVFYTQTCSQIPVERYQSAWNKEKKQDEDSCS